MDPDGILPTLGSIVVAFVGFHFGNVLVHKKNHGDRLKQWFPFATLLFASGLVMHFSGLHLNRQVFSLSFLLLSCGCAGLGLCIFYLVFDAASLHPTWLSRYRQPCSMRFAVRPTDVLRPLVWVGMNAFVIYLLGAHGVLDKLLSYVYWKKTENNMVNAVFKAVFCHDRLPDVVPRGDLNTRYCEGGLLHDQQQRWAELTFSIFRILFWFLVAGYLRLKRWYIVL